MSIDVLFLALLAIAIIKGMRKGFIVALFSFIALVIGIMAAVHLSGWVADKLSSTYPLGGLWSPAIAFLLVFITTVLVIRLFAKMMETAIGLASLGWINKLAGAALYAAMVTVSFSFFLFFGKHLHLVGPTTIEESITYPIIAPWASKTVNAFSLIFPAVKEIWSEMDVFFRQLSEKTG